MGNFKRVHIGTSGWNYKHWKGPFYPSDLPAKQWFSYYAGKFHTVEINNSFYQLPAKQTFQQWSEAAPEGFIFSLKASRYITHMKKLKDPDEPVSTLMDHAAELAGTLGPILFQLPPKWKCNPDRLAAFCASLPGGVRYAMEFRDDTWWDETVYEILKRHNVSFCLFDLAGQQTPEVVTADFVYVRLHGPDEAYQGAYDDAVLSGWAQRFADWAAQGIDVYCYFDNDENGYAALNALRLQEMVD